MMKINITAKKILDDRLGALIKGQVVELPEHKALFYVARGEAEYYETKVIKENPLSGAGIQLSASPVAQALPEQTLKPSESGEKKKRKTKKALL